MDFQIINSSSPLWQQVLKELRYDFYHLPNYLKLEARRSRATPEAFVVIEDEKIFFVPYLLRSLNNLFKQELLEQETFDIISPYGYPGILFSKSAQNSQFVNLAIAKLLQVWQERNVCSAFLRLHPILNEGLDKLCQPGLCRINGETVSIDLRLSEAEIWNRTQAAHRNKINRCKRAGLAAKIVEFKDDYIDEFIAVYQETMDKVEAPKSYYFNKQYFIELSKALGENLHLCLVEGENQIISAGLYTEYNRIVQAHLGGTKTKFLKLSPTNLETDYTRRWAKERGNEFLHLGGGVGGSKDSLYNFKAGFSKQRHTFLTMRLVIDEKKYIELVKLRAKYLNIEVEKLLKTDFFPAYRSSN
jgi:hypothetical protein